MTIYKPPSVNAIQKTLDAQLLSGATASMTLNNVTGIQDEAGVCVIDAVDANGNATPDKREYVSFTGVSGSTLTGLTRNADGGGTDQDHSVGAIVQFTPDVLQQQGLIDSYQTQHNDDGTHKAALVTTLKATGSEVNTGTEDAKIVTPKALADSAVSTASKTETFTNKTLTSPVLQGNIDGWTADTDTWKYVAANQFKVEGKDVTIKFPKGTRVAWNEGATKKYGVVIANSFSTDTTVTILTNTDYVITNTTLSSPYYSYQSSPQGYPGWFNIAAPTWTGIDDGSGGQPTTTIHRVAVNGNTLDGYVRGNGTKAGANWYFGYTFPYVVTSAFERGIGACNAFLGGTDFVGVINLTGGILYLAFESDRGFADNLVITGFSGRFSFQF